MVPHSSTLAWKIPWMEEPGRLQSMGSLRVGHNRATSLSLFTSTHWRRKWQPTPVFLPGESQGRGSLVGCCLWGRRESDTTEVTQQQQRQLSHFSRVRLFGTPWTVACQDPLSIGFSRPEYRIFLMQGSNLVSCIAGGFFTAESLGKPKTQHSQINKY